MTSAQCACSGPMARVVLGEFDRLVCRSCGFSEPVEQQSGPRTAQSIFIARPREVEPGRISRLSESLLGAL